MSSKHNLTTPPTAFAFHKAAYLVEATTLKASSLTQLLTGVTLAKDLSIFYHLHHHFFLDPHNLPEYPNEFARWVGDVLGNGVVAERLANLNLFRAANLAAVRREIAVILADYLTQTTDSQHAPPGRAFIFCQPRLVILSCNSVATTPHEFLTCMQTVESDSIAYHLFAPKAMPPNGHRNDFARWFDSWGYTALGQQLDSFDPYLNSLEDNRSYLVEMIAAQIHNQGGPSGDA